MSYIKGKDIKVPFDCLWHCYTRSFQPVVNYDMWKKYFDPMKCELHKKPEDFEKW